MTLKLVTPPQRIAVADALRELADQIEQNDFGIPDSMTWVLEAEGEIHVGCTDMSSYASCHAHLMLAKAQRKLEDGE